MKPSDKKSPKEKPSKKDSSYEQLLQEPMSKAQLEAIAEILSNPEKWEQFLPEDEQKSTRKHNSP